MLQEKSLSSINNSAKIDISIILPCYNEELRLRPTVESIINYFSHKQDKIELIIVNDGSKDGTLELIKELVQQYPITVKFLTYEINRGKGYATKLGMLAAEGKLILYNDADGASPVEEIEKLIDAINSGYDIAIGSRALASENTQVKTNVFRKIIGRIFSFFVSLIILGKIKDTQCGFKLFTQESAKFLFTRQTAERFSFDVEILFLAQKNKLKIAEVPINWTNVPGSKVNLIGDSLNMFFDLLQYRLKDLLKTYDH